MSSNASSTDAEAPLQSFHITVHARPAEVTETTVQLQGKTLPGVVVSPATLGAPFSNSFERAAEQLAALPRMFFEPDGSFVWVSGAQDAPWQLDGVLYDRAGRVLHVDLKGACPEAEFDRLLTALGWPATPVLFQLAREAVFLDESPFRRYAGWRS